MEYHNGSFLNTQICSFIVLDYVYFVIDSYFLVVVGSLLQRASRRLKRHREACDNFSFAKYLDFVHVEANSIVCNNTHSILTHDKVLHTMDPMLYLQDVEPTGCVSSL